MPAALQTTYLANRRSLISAIQAIVRDVQTAEDLAQDAYVRASRALESHPIDHLEGFLFQTARNLALDHLRRRRTRDRYEEPASAPHVESVPQDGPSAEDRLIERERAQIFDRALQSLPRRARHAWALSHLDGLSYGEIADRLGVSRNTVYNDIKLVMGHCHDVLARLERG